MIELCLEVEVWIEVITEYNLEHKEIDYEALFELCFRAHFAWRFCSSEFGQNSPKLGIMLQYNHLVSDRLEVQKVNKHIGKLNSQKEVLQSNNK